MHTSLGFLAWHGDRGLAWTHWCTQAVLVYTNPFFTLVYIGGIGAYKVFPNYVGPGSIPAERAPGNFVEMKIEKKDF